ncbi:MAG: DEAD/DEAH box helicase family protein [Actinobacteria bacterium]|nr:DEAD/DEAH box helicase family protein [Actinomycetota bacterium]
MTIFEQVEHDLAERIYEDTTCNVTLHSSGNKEKEIPPKVLIRLGSSGKGGFGFHPYHLDLMKTYGGIKFDPRQKGYVANLWVGLDFIVPRMRVPQMNIYIDREVKARRESWEVASPDFRVPSKDMWVVPPLEGKPPHESFQEDTITNALRKGSYGIFLKQGTGKSYVIANVLRHLFRKDFIDYAIICTPGTGLIDIKRKLIQFAPDSFEDADIEIVTKNNRDCLPEEGPRAKILVMTYSTLRLVRGYYEKNEKVSFAQYLRKYFHTRKLAAVMDEGHNISNSGSIQGKAASELSATAAHRFLSTGTPADKPIKYYALLKFIDPYLVRYLSLTDWKKCVADMGTSFSRYAIKDYRPEDLRYFLEGASEWYTNLQDEDCLELPPHYKKEVPVMLDEGRQRKLYEMFTSLQLSIIKAGAQVLHPRQVMNKFPYLLLSLDNPEILAKHEHTWRVTEGDHDQIKLSNQLNTLLEKFKFERDHEKLPYLREIIEDHVDDRDEKMVIWTGHPMTADSLGEILSKYNPLVIHGQSKEKGVPQEELKDKVVQQFRSQKKHQILIASYLVLDTALDITEANVQVYFDMPYALINFDQSSKRIHRAGQERPVTSYYLLFANTIDEVRFDVVMNKKALDTSALDSSMPLEDWKLLFGGSLPHRMLASTEEALQEGAGIW